MLPKAQEAVLRNPDDGVIRSKLGLAHAFLGHCERAVREGRKATELLPFTRDYADAEDPAWHLFEIYVFTNRTEDAIGQLDDLRSKDLTVDLGSVFSYRYYRPVLQHKLFKKTMEKYADTAQWRVFRETVGGI
jgi:hypothetical protein